MKRISVVRSFDGYVERHQHHSVSTNTTMTFGIYLPPQAENSPVPVLYWLSGLTCTDENFMQKSGAQRIAAELGIAIVCPDTSPRGTVLPGEHDSDAVGSGAGFYVNATQSPWDRHYKMYDYVATELPALIERHFAVTTRRSISGHSMGGHGALIVALNNPERYASVSAFAPICHPTNCPWGKNAFSHYLGDDISEWSRYDTCQLIAQANHKLPLLVDQGEADTFLSEQLKPSELQKACEKYQHPLTLRMQPGYDHSYFFVASFIEDHIRYHANFLQAKRNC